MKFLLDTNCWIHVLAALEHARDVRALLEADAADVRITDYAAHSLILLARRYKRLDRLPDFVEEVGIGQSIGLVDVPPASYARIVETMTAYRLDVDDAYQYVAAELHGLRIVSYDADFDRTPRGRLTPAQALQLFKEEPQ